MAGIAHQKETRENAHLYYEVNRDLAIKTAQKAKKEGVKQFIFLSSMSVYGKIQELLPKKLLLLRNLIMGSPKSKLKKELRTYRVLNFRWQSCVRR